MWNNSYHKSFFYSILGIVNDFLSWGGFAVLSRLTFFMYLIHIDLESIFFATLDYPYEYSDLQMVNT